MFWNVALPLSYRRKDLLTGFEPVTHIIFPILLLNNNLKSTGSTLAFSQKKCLAASIAVGILKLVNRIVVKVLFISHPDRSSDNWASYVPHNRLANIN